MWSNEVPGLTSDGVLGACGVSWAGSAAVRTKDRQGAVGVVFSIVCPQLRPMLKVALPHGFKALPHGD